MTQYGHKSQPTRTGNSGQKHGREVNVGPSTGGSGNGAAPSAKKVSGDRVIAPTPDHSAAERRYLQAKGLCYHCTSKNPEAHRARRCPHKIKGVAAQNMPADFKPED